MGGGSDVTDTPLMDPDVMQNLGSGTQDPLESRVARLEKYVARLLVRLESLEDGHIGVTEADLDLDLASDGSLKVRTGPTRKKESTYIPKVSRTDMNQSEAVEIDRLVANEVIPLFETQQDDLRRILNHWRTERISTAKMVEMIGRLSEHIKSPEHFTRVDDLLRLISASA
jgi:hypothetical protein